MTETLLVLRYVANQRALLDRVSAMIAQQCPSASVECIEAGESAAERHAELFAVMSSTRTVVMIDLDDSQQTPEQIVGRVERWLS